MPTTLEEAQTICEISQKYMPITSLANLYQELDDRVGKSSENDSLKQSLSMMREVMNNKQKRMNSVPWWMPIALYSLVGLHAALIIGMVFSFFTLPFVVPWYVFLPINAFIWFFSTNQVDCRLTLMENLMRRKLGLRLIRGFVGHYFVKPAAEMLK